MSTTSVDPVRVGAVVRYVEPSSSKIRIGYVEHFIVRGVNKGKIAVRAASTIDNRRSIVDPAKVKVVG